METEIVDRLLAKQEVQASSALRQYLLNTRSFIEEVKVVTPDIAILRSTRGEYPIFGGTAKWALITVWCKGEVQIKEWQYKYSQGPDRWDLLVREIGKVSLKESAQKFEIEIELVGGVGERNRLTSFIF